MSTGLVLNALSTLHGVDDRRKVHQERIADGLDDVAVMLSDGLLDELVMDGEHPQHAGFISTHLAAKAHYVGEHDGGQFARLGLRHLWRFLPRGRDYAARSP